MVSTYLMLHTERLPTTKVMNRTKLFLSNFLVYGLGGALSKLVPLIMVPIITRLMPSAFYYGMSDISNTIVSLFTALAVMGMYDAMYRMFFEKNEEKFKKDICSSAFFFTVFSSIIVTGLLIILQQPISQLFYKDTQYGNLVMLCAASVLIGGTNTIVSAPTRMQNKKWTFLIMNILSPIISYSIAIPLILGGHYLIAIPLAMLISAFTLEVGFMILNHKWFSIKCINWSYIKSMLKIALPLLPNFIIYWIFNSADRVMITNLLSADQEGVYAVAAKIGQISQLIYIAFAGGWQYFAFSVMRDKDNTKVISKVFEIMCVLSLTATILGTSICKFGMELLFEEEYYASYICVPYLFLAPLLLMLFQIGSNQFLVVKKTWPNLLILAGGAALNIILNLYLIPAIGIEGASIATFIGYFVSITTCVIVLTAMKLIKLSIKNIIFIVLFFGAFAVMRINAFTTYYINIPVAITYLILVLVFYWKDFNKIIHSLLKRKETAKPQEVSGNKENVKITENATSQESD